MDPTNPGAESPQGDATRRIKDAASAAVDRGKTMAGEKLSESAQGIRGAAESTAGALRRVADDVSQEHGWIGQGLRKSADAIDRAAQSMTGGNAEQAMAEIASFARRQPALFIGAGLALGFALTRIGKTAMSQSATSSPSSTTATSDAWQTTGDPMQQNLES